MIMSAPNHENKKHVKTGKQTIKEVLNAKKRRGEDREMLSLLLRFFALKKHKKTSEQTIKGCYGIQCAKPANKLIARTKTQ
jgi:hypothetical protein